MVKLKFYTHIYLKTETNAICQFCKLKKGRLNEGEWISHEERVLM